MFLTYSEKVREKKKITATKKKKAIASFSVHPHLISIFFGRVFIFFFLEGTQCCSRTSQTVTTKTKKKNIRVFYYQKSRDEISTRKLRYRAIQKLHYSFTRRKEESENREGGAQRSKK